MKNLLTELGQNAHMMKITIELIQKLLADLGENIYMMKTVI